MMTVVMRLLGHSEKASRGLRTQHAGMPEEGIKYVFYQDIFRKSDQKVVVKSTVETVCVVNGRLSNSELFDNVFAPYLK